MTPSPPDTDDRFAGLPDPGRARTLDVLIERPHQCRLGNGRSAAR
jgi:hypothetical protein